MTKLVKLKPKAYINPDMQDLYDGIEEHIEQLSPNNFLVGVLIKDLALSTTSKVVSHGLGQKYSGFLVVDRNNDSIVYTDSLTDAEKSTYIKLKANKSTTVTIWVF